MVFIKSLKQQGKRVLTTEISSKVVKVSAIYPFYYNTPISYCGIKSRGGS